MARIPLPGERILILHRQPLHLGWYSPESSAKFCQGIFFFLCSPTVKVNTLFARDHRGWLEWAPHGLHVPTFTEIGSYQQGRARPLSQTTGFPAMELFFQGLKDVPFGGGTPPGVWRLLKEFT